MSIRKIYRELIRRNVLRAVLAYMAVAWVLIEFTSVLLPTFDGPSYLLEWLVYLLALGLVFWTGFAWVYDLTPEGWKKTPDWADSTESPAVNSRRLNAVIAGGIVTALLLLLAGSFWAGSRWSQKESLAYNPVYRIAVIPLQADSTRIAEAASYQNGITGELIDALSRSRSLMVLSLASTEVFQAGLVPGNPYLKSTSEQIDYFVSGILEVKDHTLNISVAIRKKLEQEPFWNRDYTGDIRDTRMQLQAISADIEGALGLKGGKRTAEFKKELTAVRPETFELYLKGKYYLSLNTLEDMQRGLVYLQEAVDKNPSDAEAYAGLAEGYVTWGHGLMPPTDILIKAREATKRALSLDSTNARAWAALADYYTYFGHDWEKAEYAFKKADSLNPNLAWNHYHYSWHLALFGKMNQAIYEHKRAQELDPFTPAHTIWLAELYRWVGEYDLALGELDKAFGMKQGFHGLALAIKGLVLEDMGQTEAGLEAFRLASEMNKGFYLFYGPALFRHGRNEEAEKILNELAMYPPIPFNSLVMATMFHAAGDLDKTFEHLDKARLHAWYAGFVRIYLADEKMQRDPRFRKLLDELKLPPPTPLEYDPPV
jgi:tetratricopeptide (TPR) repeat protein